jgi:excisionase family DNA binding protein
MNRIEELEERLAAAFERLERANAAVRAVTADLMELQKAEERLWTVNDAAQYLAVSTAHVRILIRSGELPTRRVGLNDGGIRFDPEVVKNYGRLDAAQHRGGRTA